MRGDSGVPYRLRFSKRGKVRFISHRDVVRSFDRAFRVAELPLAFTGGFSPRPKMGFGLALPLGYESEAEYLDVELLREVEDSAMTAEVSAALPEGVEVTGVARLETRAVSLQEAVTLLRYEVEVIPGSEGAGSSSTVGSGVCDPGLGAGLSGHTPADHAEDLAASVAVLLGAEHVEITLQRKGRSTLEDVRPAVQRVEIAGFTDRGIVLAAEIATRPRHLRPTEMVAALQGSWHEGAVLRTAQWIERDGARHEPLDADSRPCAEEAYV